MLNDALLLFPDFSLIALGYALMRWSPLRREVWDGVERLVYFVLFPALLFSTTARGHFSLGGDGAMLAVGVAVLLSGIALSYLALLWPGADRRCAASGVQTAFRFNSYIALAVADGVGGAPAVSLVAVLIAVGVPIANIAAVWPLARHGDSALWRELARNPLILATAGGLLTHAFGLQLPRPVDAVFDRLSAASIALGLMTVGAGLRLRGLHRELPLAAWFLALRHLLLPLLAWTLARALHLPPLAATMVTVFSAMPTASSAYVLAARMGGDAGFVAGLVSLSTLLGALSLPAFLALSRLG